MPVVIALCASPSAFHTESSDNECTLEPKHAAVKFAPTVPTRTRAIDARPMVTAAPAPRPALVTTAVASILLTLLVIRLWDGNASSTCSGAGQLAPGSESQAGKVLVFQHIYAINNYKEVVQDQVMLTGQLVSAPV